MTAKKDNNEGKLFIGSKPFMSYISSLVILASQRKEVEIKARGKFISKAVDVAQMAKNRFVDGLEVKSIDIGSEEFENEQKRIIRVSTINIVVGK